MRWFPWWCWRSSLFSAARGRRVFGQNRDNLRVYRQAGLEYVDFIRTQQDDHTALTRYLSDLRLRQLNLLLHGQKLPLAGANGALAGFDDFANEFGEAVDPVRALVSELTELATATKTKFILTQDRQEERRQLLAEGKREAAALVKIEEVNFGEELKPLRATLPAFRKASRLLGRKLVAALDRAPRLPAPDLQVRMDRFKQLALDHVATFPETERKLETWDYTQPVPGWQALTAFVFGREWLTASFWQDWYGVIPLLVGSLMVSAVALCLAVPLGVGAAIYVNQIASAAKQRFIKPCIEFISAIPSVVLGFLASPSRAGAPRPFPAILAVVGSRVSLQRTAQYSHRGLPARPDRGADDLYAGRGRLEQRAAGLPRSFLRAGGVAVADHHPDRGARVTVRHRVGGIARARAGFRRDHGGPVVRRQPDRDS